jgi:hypothetical protein
MNDVRLITDMKRWTVATLQQLGTDRYTSFKQISFKKEGTAYPKKELLGSILPLMPYHGRIISIDRSETTSTWTIFNNRLKTRVNDTLNEMGTTSAVIEDLPPGNFVLKISNSDMMYFKLKSDIIIKEY